MSVLKIKNQYGNWTRVPVVDGKDGISLLSGESNPSNDIGNEEDLYLNLINGDIYKKSEGIWKPSLNIKGKDGVNGINGVPGPKGNDGQSVVNGLTLRRDSSGTFLVEW